MDSRWCLTDATKLCLTVVSSKSLVPKLQTLAGTAAWRLTAPGIAAGISTSMSLVQRQLFHLFMNVSWINLTVWDGKTATFLIWLVLFSWPFFPTSFSHNCRVCSRWFCGGGDSDFEQPHLSCVRSPVLPSRPRHLAQGRHSVRVQPQCPSAPRFEITYTLHTNVTNRVCVAVVIHRPCFLTGGRTLQILNAKEEDAGRYTCVATNEAGESLKHYEVKVYGEMIWLLAVFGLCLLGYPISLKN